MELRKVTAIIRSDMLDRVEGRLQDRLVKGRSVSHVKGYGEYANFFTHDWLVRHARIEIFTEKTRAEEVAKAIMETAHTGGEGRRHSCNSARREGLPYQDQVRR